MLTFISNLPDHPENPLKSTASQRWSLSNHATFYCKLWGYIKIAVCVGLEEWGRRRILRDSARSTYYSTYLKTWKREWGIRKCEKESKGSTD